MPYTMHVKKFLWYVVSVTTFSPVVEARANTTINLQCEMKDYIHSDTDFKWRKGSEVIKSSQDHLIQYSDGFVMMAQNGGEELTSSRISRLTIFSAEEGIYTCFVEGTNVSTNVQVNIIPPGTNNYNIPLQPKKLWFRDNL